MANIFKRFRTQTEGKKTIFDTFGNVNARWYGLKDNEGYAQAFSEVPELNAIVFSKAKQLSKGIWRCKELSTGEPIENDKFLNLLSRPNPLQSSMSWLEQLYIDFQVFGNAFPFLLTPLHRTPTPDLVKAIYNLPARYTFAKSSGKLFYQTKLDDIVEKYVLLLRGQNYDFRTNQVSHIASSNMDFLNGQYVSGESPLKSLDWALSNIKAAYEARNVYITRRGAFGVLSNNTKGDMGVQPIEKKEELQKSLNKYGLTKGQWQIIVTNADLKWNPISIPIKDLELYKEVKESTIALANRYDYPILLMNYLEGSTFSNMNVAWKQLYTDSILPDAKHISQEINRTVNSSDFNREYYLDYSHIEALQADKKIEAERHKIAVDTVLALNEAIQLGNVSYEAAVNILINVVGLKQSEAVELLDKQNAKKETE